MDGLRGALLPIAAGFRLSGSQARGGVRGHVVGSSVHVPVAQLEWCLTPGSGACLDCPLTKNSLK